MNIEKDIDKLKGKIKERVNIVGQIEAANITGLHTSDISSFLNHSRVWSYEKIVKVAKKLKLY